MRLVDFHAPDGAVVPINPEDVETLRHPIGGHPAARTVIVLVNGEQAVRESMAEVEEKLK